MLQQKYYQLLEKIQNKIFNFDKEERCLLTIYPDLTRDIWPKLADDPSYWNDELYRMVGDDIFEYIAPEYSDKFWIGYFKFIVTNPEYFYSDFLDEFLGMVVVSDETKSTLEEIFAEGLKKLEEKNTDTITGFSEEDVIEALEKKNFRWISLLNRKKSPMYNPITPEVMKKLIAEFPYDEYDSPVLFADWPYLLKDVFDKISLETLLEVISNTRSTANREKLLTREELVSLLRQKISKKKLDKPSYLELDISEFLFLLTEDEKKEFSKLFFENNILDYIKVAILYEQYSKEEIILKILEYINTSETLNPIFFQETLDYIKDDKRIIDALIQNGYILEILTRNILDKWPEKEALLIENINHNPEYNDFLNNVPLLSELLSRPNLLDALLKHPGVKSINADTESIIGTEAISYLKKVIKTRPDISISNLSYAGLNDYNPEILQCLLENKKYEEAIYLIDNNWWARTKNKITNYPDIKELILSSFAESFYFPTLLIRTEPTIIEDDDILKCYCKHEHTTEQLINFINHNEEYYKFYNHENFLLLKDYIANKINVDVTRLEKLEEKFGATIIRYYNNENIIELLKLNETTFNRIIELFNAQVFTMSDLESSYDSLKQYEFSKVHTDIVSVFPNILHAIQDQNDEFIENYINEMYKYLDHSFFKKFTTKYTLPEEYNEDNPKLFVTFVIEKLKQGNPDKRDKYLDILHHITDYFILKKREEYRTTYDMIGELDMSYGWDSKSFETEFFKYLIRKAHMYFVNYTIDDSGQEKNEFLSLDQYIGRKMVKYNLDPTLIKECLIFFCENEDIAQNYRYTYDITTIKKQYRYLLKAVTEISKEEPTHSIFQENVKDDVLLELDRANLIKRIYMPGVTDINLYEMLSTLKLDVLESCVIYNEEIYTSLKKLMDKRKLHILPVSLKNILNTPNINVSADFSNLAAFISYYAQIYEKEKSTLASNNKPTDNISLNLINILINAEVYAGVSSIYSQILGDQDFKLIKSNPGPNSASMKLANDGRLKEAVELTKQNYQREKVTVPTFNEIVELNNAKKIRIVVGNFTHPSNLSHGERTGSCMRIGGVGETLFGFCLKNPNGFHIRFEDPDNKNYISRVSGFRNGNTVFLNELRYSCDPDKYTNEDIIKACKIASQMLIDLSKQSSCPIDNVVVHRAYAAVDMKDENVNLNVKNIKEGLPHFYSDIGQSVIVMATTAKDNEFVPVNLNKQQIPEYLPAREQPTISTDIQEVSSKITRVATIKRMLEGEDYEYIEPIEFTQDLTYAIVNEDWYIYVDGQGVIHSDYITIDPRARQELSEYLIQIKDLVAQENLTNQTTNKEETYGF